MFESAEIGHRTSKADYEEALPELRAQLLDAQFELLEQKRFSVAVLINGVEGAGKGETVNLLNAWMDPRHIETWAFDAASTEEAERPYKWRLRFKITEEDWRNRDKWDDYERAVCDMIDRTSTETSPWTVVEANNKYFARIKVLHTLCERLDAALEH